jgi:hydroxymethylpyrimidine pyrophosphatase-like HAD family hydrolase
VIAENGGLYYARHGDAVHKVFVQSEEERLRDRVRLRREIAAAIRKTPGTRLSHDSPAREVDLAVDYNEHVKLGVATAIRLEEMLRARGVNAVRSSVHVNFWLGDFDKLSTVRTFCQRVLRLSLKTHPDAIVYAGDSYNDAPMFGGLPLSVGVANVREVLPTIDAPPAFITRGAEGVGFRELAGAVLRTRR